MSSRCGRLPSHSEREARTSGRAALRRVTCQYQPDSGNSNSGSPSWPNFSPASSGEATSAIKVLRYTLKRRSKASSTDCSWIDESAIPVMIRITTVQMVAERKSRSASELARIAWRREQIAEAADGLDHFD